MLIYITMISLGDMYHKNIPAFTEMVILLLKNIQVNNLIKIR